MTVLLRPFPAQEDEPLVPYTGCERRAEGEASREKTEPLAKKTRRIASAFTPSSPIIGEGLKMNYNSPKTYFNAENLLLTEHTFFTDGGCLGSNQKDKSLRKMAICVCDWNGLPIIYKTAARGSNNIAEFLAIKECMLYAAANNIKKIHIYTDSTNNIAWFNKVSNHAPNDAKVIKDMIRGLAYEVQTTISWIPREYNLAGRYLEFKFKNRYA